MIFVITTSKGLVYVIRAATESDAITIFHRTWQGAIVSAIIKAENQI